MSISNYYLKFLAQVLFAKIKGVEFLTYTVANHRGGDQDILSLLFTVITL